MSESVSRFIHLFSQQLAKEKQSRRLNTELGRPVNLHDALAGHFSIRAWHSQWIKSSQLLFCHNCRSRTARSWLMFQRAHRSHVVIIDRTDPRDSQDAHGAGCHTSLWLPTNSYLLTNISEYITFFI